MLQENHVLRTIENDINSRLLSFRRLEMFRTYSQENIRNTQLCFMFLSFLFLCQNFSVRSVIVYSYINPIRPGRGGETETRITKFTVAIQKPLNL